MLAVLRSIALWIVVAVLTAGAFFALLPCAIVSWPWDRKKNVPHWFAKRWARSLIAVNPACRVSVVGIENLSKIGGSGAAVIAANHESMADIIALYYLGYPFKWIAKRSLFFVPCIGWAMWFAGYIPLQRGRKDSIVRCMAAAADWLRRGVSIMIFPEGTRSFDGRVKPFKDGAFKLSVETGVPIIPVALEGPRGLLNKGSWLFAASSRMVVRVGEPIRPQGTGAAEIERLKAETRGWILRTMADMKGVSVESLDASGAPPRTPLLEPVGNTATG